MNYLYRVLAGSRSTKLDSGAQKPLRRYPIEGYGPRPQASARLARAEVGQHAGVRANADRRPFRSPVLVARADLVKIGHFDHFPACIINHLREEKIS